MVASVDETDIGRLTAGQTAAITTGALPGEKFTGTVSFVSPYGNTMAGPATFTVKLKVDGAGRQLQRGVSAVATIATAKKDNVLLVPAGALKGSKDNYYVDTVKAMPTGSNPEIEKRVVTIGLRIAEFVEIVSGLAEGEMVLVQTLHR